MWKELKNPLISFKEKLVKALLEEKITEKKFEEIFDEVEIKLYSAGVSYGTCKELRECLKRKIVDLKVPRGKREKAVFNIMRKELLGILQTPEIDLPSEVSKKGGKPYVIIFVGFNGVGKSLSVAKTARYLKEKGFRVLIAAADTFRAAGIEQMCKYAEDVKVQVVKQRRGSDSAAVIYDAIEKARTKRFDVVCADTAGRAHSNENLLEELKKVVRVNNPDLKVLVIDGLAGNDAEVQCKFFDEAIQVDCAVITKIDATDKGGVILTVANTLKKPILFLGCGQGYMDFIRYEPEKIIEEII